MNKMELVAKLAAAANAAMENFYQNKNDREFKIPDLVVEAELLPVNVDPSTNFVDDEEIVKDILDQYKDNYPEVYGINRSGSTLLRNIVNTIFHDNIAVQRAAYFETDRKIIGVYRDFRDASISRWRVNRRGQNARPLGQGETTDWSSVQPHATSIRDQARHDLQRLYERYGEDQLLLVKYENFHNNFDYLFDKMEIFLNIEITHQLREFTKNAWSKERVYKEYTGPLGTFIKTDVSTYFHGNHINESHKGKHGTWKELLNEDHHDHMNDFFREEIERWGYDI